MLRKTLPPTIPVSVHYNARSSSQTIGFV